MLLAWFRQKLSISASDKEEELLFEDQAGLEIVDLAAAEVVRLDQQPSDAQENKQRRLETLVPECDVPDEIELKADGLLSQEQKRDCRELLEKLKADASVEKWSEARSSVVRLCTGLGKAKISWIRDLAKLALYLSFRLDQRLSGRKLDEDMSGAERTCLAALSYLVEIDDVIPDHVIGSGYADDAYVFKLAIKQLRTTVDGKRLLDI